jgi:hypothetical protein
MQGKPSQEGGKPAEEAEFLVEEFELTEREASELVTDGDGEAGETQAAVLKKRASREALQDAPVPEAPKSDLTADSDEERLKPVVRSRNDRTGGG